MGAPAAPPALDLGETSVPLEVRVHPRARRIGLRIDPADGHLVLTLPHERLLNDGLAFARRQRGWIVRQHASVPERVPFADGAELPYLGEPHRVRHAPHRRGVVWREAGEIHVAGDAAFLARRLNDWLRGEARRLLAERAQAFAARIDRRVTRLTVRDTRSRWGSCSEHGALSFCWRLVLAPEPVLAYVAAHEVAHLKHLHHGPAFWDLVAELCPDHKAQRRWLRRHGQALHRYG